MTTVPKPIHLLTDSEIRHQIEHINKAKIKHPNVYGSWADARRGELQKELFDRKTNKKKP